MQSSIEVIVAARNSPLSKKQVEEVYHALKLLHPSVVFRPIYMDTVGDLRQDLSLRSMERTDFFTKEIDDFLLQKKCRAAIHSAKDLPDPLPKGLKLAALTRGVDSSDMLVMRLGEAFPHDGLVGTSSLRREESVKQLFPQARFVDIRGKIEERLHKLYTGPLDGVVIANAALIRLGIKGFSTLILPGETAPLQGRLAVIIREEDREMEELFSVL